MTTNINFKVLDYTGNESLSSYSLSSTPLLFVPEYIPFENTSILWEFGDGTTSKSISAYKHYSFPGKYTVKMIIYDCHNNPLESIYSKEILIYDLLPLTFSVGMGGYEYMVSESGEIIISETGDFIINDYNYKNGKIGGPITIKTSYPHYQTPLNVFYSVSGSNSNNYWAINSNKFSHLENYYSIYDKFFNYSLSGYQFREIENIKTENTNIFAKIENNQIVYCKSTDVGSFFVGVSGIKEVYFKDDTVNIIKLYFYFDKTKYQIPNFENINYLNNLGITIPLEIYNNTPNSISITSNGLDGEYYTVDSFKISPVKYYNTQIPFLIKLKDAENFTVKNFNPIELSALYISISATINGSLIPLNSSYYTISSLNYTLSGQNHGGSFRGMMLFHQLSTFPLENVTMDVVVSLDEYTFNERVDSFSVYPLNYVDFYKINEDFDPVSTLRSISFQETLFDKNKLYDDFFSSVLGDENSDHNGISRKIYEKIANFVENTQDIDVCEINSLDSLSKFVNFNNSNEEVYIYPEKIRRLIDVLSINKNKLIGTSNKFRENFDVRGHSDKTKYGRNIGDKIDTMHYTISAGTDIVALEKFSNTYSLLNTYQPVSAVGSYVYNLSSYSDDWGWPLVLPPAFDFFDIEKYYLFFEYNMEYDNTLMDSVIDYNNNKTTVTSFSGDLFENVVQNMFLSNLYESLYLGK